MAGGLALVLAIASSLLVADAITEVGTAGLLVLLGGSPGAASATALLYAIYAHLLVVPFGLAALLAWWLGPGRAARGADAPRGGARAPG